MNRKSTKETAPVKSRKLRLRKETVQDLKHKDAADMLIRGGAPKIGSGMQCRGMPAGSVV